MNCHKEIGNNVIFTRVLLPKFLKYSLKKDKKKCIRVVRWQCSSHETQRDENSAS